MTRLSENFNREEFACRCGCGFDTVDSKLIDVLQFLRDESGLKVKITSGCRCVPYNAKVGGSTNSQHTYGRAADITVEGMLPVDVYDVLDLMYGKNISLGLYETFIHVDTRTNGGKRWKG